MENFVVVVQGDVVGYIPATSLSEARAKIGFPPNPTLEELEEEMDSLMEIEFRAADEKSQQEVSEGLLQEMTPERLDKIYKDIVDAEREIDNEPWTGPGDFGGLDKGGPFKGIYDDPDL